MQSGVNRWNKILAEAGLTQRLALPHIAFNRGVGAFAGIEASPDGEKLSADEWERRKGQWLPTDVDKTHVRSLMQPVHERGKIAAWIAPPRNGIHWTKEDTPRWGRGTRDREAQPRSGATEQQRRPVNAYPTETVGEERLGRGQAPVVRTWRRRSPCPGANSGLRAVVRDARGDQRVDDFQLCRSAPDYYGGEVAVGGNS